MTAASGFVVRRAVEGDADAIAQLTSPPTNSLTETLALVALAAEGGLALVAVDATGRVAGHLVVSGPRAVSGGGELAIYVADERRRQGLGAALMSAAIEWARGTELTALVLDVERTNHAARALYAGHGLREVARRKNVIRLQLPLSRGSAAGD